jgi:hypothetical protein
MAKPNKKVLGTGMLRRAGEGLLSRRDKIDAAVDGPAPKPKKKLSTAYKKKK